MQTLEAERPPVEDDAERAADVDIDATAAPIDPHAEIDSGEEVDPDLEVDFDEEEVVDAANSGTINLLYDLGVYLKASQGHVNPTHTKVARVIAYELQQAGMLLGHGNLELQLVVGEEPIQAKPITDKPKQSQAIALEPGTELRIAGTENGEVVAQLEDKPVRLTTDAVASVFVGSGQLIDEQYGDVRQILREEGRKEYFGGAEPEAPTEAEELLADSIAPEPEVEEPDITDEPDAIEAIEDTAAEDEEEDVTPEETDEEPETTPAPEEQEPDEVKVEDVVAVDTPEDIPAPEQPHEEEELPAAVADTVDEVPDELPAAAEILGTGTIEARRTAITDLIRAKGQAKPPSATGENELYADVTQVNWMHANGQMCSIYLPKNTKGNKPTFTVPLLFQGAEAAVPAGSQKARWAVVFHDLKFGNQTFFLHASKGKVGICLQPNAKQFGYDFRNEEETLGIMETQLKSLFEDNGAERL